jgi:hypothetical protein
MENENITYETSDLYLVSYLKVKGFKFNIKNFKNRVKFQFEKTEEFDKELKIYFSEMGSVEPLLFSNTIKNIKNLIHNQIY